MSIDLKRVIDSIYLVSSIAGATLVALNIGQQLLGYSLFMVSSIAGAYLIINSNVSRSLLTVTAIYFIINLVGIIRA